MQSHSFDCVYIAFYCYVNTKSIWKRLNIIFCIFCIIHKYIIYITQQWLRMDAHFTLGAVPILTRYVIYKPQFLVLYMLTPNHLPNVVICIKRVRRRTRCGRTEKCTWEISPAQQKAQVLKKSVWTEYIRTYIKTVTLNKHYIIILICVSRFNRSSKTMQRVKKNYLDWFLYWIM